MALNSTTKLFRAERLTDRLLSGDENARRSTMRLPVNVSYIIDNLWEYLRPEHMPCRRHAVFASPSPALALANSTSVDANHAVYEVVISGPSKIAQLEVKDAKFHPDIKNILGQLPKRVAGLGGDRVKRQSAAMLFLPGATKQDWEELAATSETAAALIAEMTSLSTFWASASQSIVSSEGEIFFELDEGSSYAPRNLLSSGQ